MVTKGGLEVLVGDFQEKDVPLYREWIGTADGFVNVEIKAQVFGCLVKQEYTEASVVRQGQPLFQIDSRPFQAELDQAEGRLRNHKAGWRRRAHSSHKR